MKKINLVLLSLLMGISTITYGQKKKAEDILKSVTDKTTSYKAVKIDFSLLMTNEEADINDEKTGTLFLSGNKFRLEVPGQIVISNGKTTWTYLEDDEEVMINDVDNDEKSITPNKLLTSYNDNYKVKLNKSAEAGINTKVVDLLPKEDENFKKIEIYINTKLNQIEKFIIYDNNNSEYTYNIDKFIPNPKVTPSTFEFSEKEFPDADINDMR
ncbi:MAG: outer membrane lipoprotein carrier protein LolA [Hyphomicrobiales bacterium]